MTLTSLNLVNAYFTHEIHFFENIYIFCIFIVFFLTKEKKTLMKTLILKYRRNHKDTHIILKNRKKKKIFQNQFTCDI